jgi:hypothetical protein
MIIIKAITLGLTAATAYVVFKTVAALVSHQESQLHMAMKFAGME